MTSAEKKAVCQVLMEVMLYGKPVPMGALRTMKVRAKCVHIGLKDLGYITDAWETHITEKGKQFVLDMDTDNRSSPEGKS